MDLAVAFAVPWQVFNPILAYLNTTTTKDDHTYWHIHLTEGDQGTYSLLLPKKSGALPLDEYRIDLSAMGTGR
jgi:hypothetical protein